jgi:hypothetical protein
MNIIERYGAEVRRNQELLEQLQTVAKNISQLDIEQPSQCLFGKGFCGYPIDDCFNCPMHEWTDSFIPTQCEFK